MEIVQVTVHASEAEGGNTTFVCTAMYGESIVAAREAEGFTCTVVVLTKAEILALV